MEQTQLKREQQQQPQFLSLFDAVPGLKNYIVASEPFDDKSEAYAEAANRGFIPGHYTCVLRDGKWYIAQEK